jgi:hypothetical protein
MLSSGEFKTLGDKRRSSCRAGAGTGSDLFREAVAGIIGLIQNIFE